jgi:hypothetical protein
VDGVNPPPGFDGWQVEPDGTEFDTSGWHERVARLYAHWRALHPAPGTLPGRRHFDPVQLRGLLGSIWMLDVQREPFRLRYRLFGTNLVETFGADFTGRWYDEARPALRASGDERYRRMADTGRATWRRGRPVLAVDPHWHTTENVMLPMAEDGRTVDMLLCMSIYYGHDGRVR